MVSFEIFVKSMPPSLSELKVLPSFCFAFKIPDDVTVTSMYVHTRDKLVLKRIPFCIDFLNKNKYYMPAAAAALGLLPVYG